MKKVSDRKEVKDLVMDAVSSKFYFMNLIFGKEFGMKKVIALTLGMLMMVLVMGTPVNAQDVVSRGVGINPIAKANPKGTLPPNQVLSQGSTIVTMKVSKLGTTGLENVIDFTLSGQGNLTTISGDQVNVSGCTIFIQILSPYGDWIWDTVAATVDNVTHTYTYTYSANQFFRTLNYIYSTTPFLRGGYGRATQGNAAFSAGTTIWYPNGIYQLYFQAMCDNKYWAVWNPGVGNYLGDAAGLYISVNDPLS